MYTLNIFHYDIFFFSDFQLYLFKYTKRGKKKSYNNKKLEKNSLMEKRQEKLYKIVLVSECD